MATLTPSVLLVLAFLDLHPPPVCTPALPNGARMMLVCDPHDTGNDSGLIRYQGKLHRCARRFEA